MKSIFDFRRVIRKREAINKYGKLGFTTHEEQVLIEAETLEEAKKLIEPFNYKKHIRFECFANYDSTKERLNEIIDLGRTDLLKY